MPRTSNDPCVFRDCYYMKADGQGHRSPSFQAVYRVAEQKILESPQRWALWMDYHLMLAPDVRNASLNNDTTIVAVS